MLKYKYDLHYHFSIKFTPLSFLMNWKFFFKNKTNYWDSKLASNLITDTSCPKSKEPQTLFNKGHFCQCVNCYICFFRHPINKAVRDFFFFLEFQPMTSAPDDNSLSSDQDTNQFLMYVEIELQISYTTIRDFIS